MEAEAYLTSGSGSRIGRTKIAPEIFAGSPPFFSSDLCPVAHMHEDETTANQRKRKRTHDRNDSKMQFSHSPQPMFVSSPIREASYWTADSMKKRALSPLEDEEGPEVSPKVRRGPWREAKSARKQNLANLESSFEDDDSGIGVESLLDPGDFKSEEEEEEPSPPPKISRKPRTKRKLSDAFLDSPTAPIADAMDSLQLNQRRKLSCPSPPPSAQKRMRVWTAEQVSTWYNNRRSREKKWVRQLATIREVQEVQERINTVFQAQEEAHQERTARNAFPLYQYEEPIELGGGRKREGKRVKGGGVAGGMDPPSVHVSMSSEDLTASKYIQDFLNNEEESEETEYCGAYAFFG